MTGSKKSKRKPVKNVKAKGSNWELKVAELLTKATEKEFRRVPLSGAWTGGQNRIRNANVFSGGVEALTGDIMCPDGFPFSIECKNTQDYPRFHLMIANGDIQVNDYIRQSTEDAIHVKKIPMLALKRTRMGEFAMIPRRLGERAFGNLDFMNYISYIYDDPDCNIGCERDWILFDFSQFIEFIHEIWKGGIDLIEEDYGPKKQID